MSKEGEMGPLKFSQVVQNNSDLVLSRLLLITSNTASWRGLCGKSLIKYSQPDNLIQSQNIAEA